MCKPFNSGAADAIMGLPSKNPFGFDNRGAMEAYNAGYAEGQEARQIRQHQEITNVFRSMAREINKSVYGDDFYACAESETEAEEQREHHRQESTYTGARS